MARLLLAMLVIAVAALRAHAAEDDIMNVIEKLDSDSFALSPDEARRGFADAHERLKREPNPLALARLKAQECYWHVGRWSTPPADSVAFARAALKDVEAGKDPKAVAD